MYEIKIRKNEIREQYLSRRSALDEGFKENADEKLRRLFTTLISYRYANTVLLYVPVKGEIDILPIAQKALEGGKSVAFPCCNADERTMEFRVVSSLDQLTEKDSYGIPEPSRDCPVYEIGGITHDVCIVPAVVYDKAGYRVGYGRGYYDRYLSAFRGTKVGLVYSDFVIDSVPRGRFDLAVDVIVTEKGVRTVKKV